MEIFCPDWENNTLFLSHMGEVNYALIDGRPALKEMPFIYGEAKNPVIGYARYRKGKAVFVNLFRDAEGYKLLVAPGNHGRAGGGGSLRQQHARVDASGDAGWRISGGAQPRGGDPSQRAGLRRFAGAACLLRTPSGS